MALNKAKIITVTSVKGGTGKTTTALNLAGIIGQANKKTILVDLDLYSGSITASLNLETDIDIYTLNEDMMNNRFKQIDDYIVKYSEYIDVLAAPIDPRSVSKISAKFIDILLSRLSLQYEVIVLDTNHVMDKYSLVALDHSDFILYVITNDLMDIKNMKTMVSIYRDMGKTNYRILLNEAKQGNTKYKPIDIKNMLDTDIEYILPKSFYHKNIEKYVYEGKIMTFDKSILHSKGGEELIKIAKDALKE